MDELLPEVAKCILPPLKLRGAAPYLSYDYVISIIFKKSLALLGADKPKQLFFPAYKC